MSIDRRRGAICGTHDTFTVVFALQCPVCALEQSEARVKKLEECIAARDDLYGQAEDDYTKKIVLLESRVKELAEKWTHDMREGGRRIKELEARVKELEGALQEILAVPVTVTGDSDLLRQRHLVDGIAERVLHGGEE